MMKFIVVVVFIALCLGDNAQFEIVFPQQPSPTGLYSLNYDGNINPSKIPKFTVHKTKSDEDKVIMDFYNNSGLYLGYSENGDMSTVNEKIIRVKNDTISIYENKEDQDSLLYFIVLKKEKDKVKKELILANGKKYYSQYYQLSDLKIVESTIFLNNDTLSHFNFRYSSDTTYIDYHNHQISGDSFDVRIYKHDQILNVDYYDQSKERIVYKSEYYCIDGQYIPKSSSSISSDKGEELIFENPKTATNSCDSILYHYKSMNKPQTRWIVIERNRHGRIIYQKNSINAYDIGYEYHYKYYKIGKRKGDLKEEKVTKDGEILEKNIYKIKYYSNCTNPIKEWVDSLGSVSD